MIRSFLDRDTERFAARQQVEKWSPERSQAAFRKLRVLDAAEVLADLRVPSGSRLEGFEGNHQGQHAIRVTDQWRIYFRWEGGNANHVEIVDEHEPGLPG
ncbi:MAG: hypothetical protein EA388_00225 [Nitriliruptor sp.]|nr:MAG: hypothetical protein EA388_00225 [Nitriliruptor sp.]